MNIPTNKSSYTSIKGNILILKWAKNRGTIYRRYPNDPWSIAKDNQSHYK